MKNHHQLRALTSRGSPQLFSPIIETHTRQLLFWLSKEGNSHVHQSRPCFKFIFFANAEWLKAELNASLDAIRYHACKYNFWYNRITTWLGSQSITDSNFNCNWSMVLWAINILKFWKIAKWLSSKLQSVLFILSIIFVIKNIFISKEYKFLNNLINFKTKKQKIHQKMFFWSYKFSLNFS